MSWFDSLPLKRMCDDMVAGSTSIIGTHLTNVTKTLLTPLAPFAITANYADRVQDYCTRIGQKIPPENLLKEAQPQIVGPCLDALKYIPSDAPLTEMFLNLLASSIDKERTCYAHPAFPLILSHLSHDEAYILYRVSEKAFESEEYAEPTSEKLLFCPLLLRNYLFYPDNYDTYGTHLNSLGLVSFYHIQSSYHHNKLYDRIILSAFGKLFANACISDNMKEIFKEK